MLLFHSTVVRMYVAAMAAERVSVLLAIAVLFNLGVTWRMAFFDNVAGGGRGNGSHFHIQESFDKMMGKFLRGRDEADAAVTNKNTDVAIKSSYSSTNSTRASRSKPITTTTVGTSKQLKVKKKNTEVLYGKPWERLPESGKVAAKLLGYSQKTWDEDVSIDVYEVGWDVLSDEKKEAATVLGVKKWFGTYEDSTAPYQMDCNEDDIMLDEEELLAEIRVATSAAGSASNAKEEIHGSAGLNCDVHGGPTNDDAASEMIWWHDIPSDAQYKSPFLDENKAQYLSFEPDNAGFNNARMGMEVAIVLAAATGRTLVLPPDSGIAHLEGSYTVHDFFPLHSLMKEHNAVGIEIISMDEFLRREGMEGNLQDTTSGEVLKPPGNRLDWTKHKKRERDCLWEYLRSVGNNPRWSHTNCVLAIPASRSAEDVNALKHLELELERTGWNNVSRTAKEKMYWGNATSVDSSPFDRLREIVDTRKRLCIYDEEIADSKLVHISNRLLVHFYSFLFFQDWKMDVYYKRYARDHIRYTDDIMCAAARVVDAVRKKAREADPSNTEGIFDTMHIRRGDFKSWYDIGDLTAKDFYDQSASKLTKGSTIFIATDERDKTFFDIFKKHYHVYFLDDFKDLVEGIDFHYFGMVDQVVAAKGRIFFGSYHSTLSGYANRIRGYYSTYNKLPGYEYGSTQSYYFAADTSEAEISDIMTHYTNIDQPVWLREFPVSWRDIDRGIDLLHSS